MTREDKILLSIVGVVFGTTIILIAIAVINTLLN